MSKMEMINKVLNTKKVVSKEYEELKASLENLIKGVSMENFNNPLLPQTIIERGQKILKDLKEKGGVVSCESIGGIQTNKIIPNSILNKYLVHPEMICMGDAGAIKKLRSKNERTTKAGLSEIKRIIK